MCARLSWEKPGVDSPHGEGDVICSAAGRHMDRQQCHGDLWTISVLVLPNHHRAGQVKHIEAHVICVCAATSWTIASHPVALGHGVALITLPSSSRRCPAA
ncbi:hypothetical protein GUJ93_ZPchr0006g43296 [Zizania palustris]|uniref:Uncharacterized protein n=1 Tax=Zizania palustris TaxID=103762 RepID=A0A8J5SKJ4_ZIZPA|nr:hypothetical protein GUJ93_ZPchr0006g43296 [Zizania palustris]